MPQPQLESLTLPEHDHLLGHAEAAHGLPVAELQEEAWTKNHVILLHEILLGHDLLPLGGGWIDDGGGGLEVLQRFCMSHILFCDEIGCIVLHKY